MNTAMNSGKGMTNRSLNTYLEHQSRKDTSLFEGNGGLQDLMISPRPFNTDQASVGSAARNPNQQELHQMEQWLKRSRANIEQAIARAGHARLDDDDLSSVVVRFQ